MLTGLKTLNSERVDDIHKRVLKLSPDITFRIFPIYIRYLKGDNMFAILYFNNQQYNELGVVADNAFSVKCGDASWMKYAGVKYSVKIMNDENLTALFKEIGAKLR
jgi:hypothetical protein